MEGRVMKGEGMAGKGGAEFRAGEERKWNNYTGGKEGN